MTLGLTRRAVYPDDRRHDTLTLPPAGQDRAREVATVEATLHDAIESLVAGQPLDQTLTLLRTLADAFSKIPWHNVTYFPGTFETLRTAIK